MSNEAPETKYLSNHWAVTLLAKRERCSSVARGSTGVRSVGQSEAMCVTSPFSPGHHGLAQRIPIVLRMD
ncbi:hypothetical protein RRG08_027624 [Elysia crispata]|uniref:Uncharacterized protein n=1 Tax=Elysia crispata TaxID=231223 RepID=A0AAE1AF15_9GAST|nr:hypothetical protein RRG08_027624 [Elysia crispata]